ncbi:pyrokinin-1 receptor-like [Sitophilus oryzae]|uniref:Pyrokinin-1 receptor-like n=1 Tax=Sitophilus oryzae TaxID=7048 RepID=A0A6J2XYW4_SITOR|nr:pyrokinin-1 receptor-like [Sitophilus oryzae]XP_030756693.1 pyrokinin-1 receptor-like [Sitophilus oryzae]
MGSNANSLDYSADHQKHIYIMPVTTTQSSSNNYLINDSLDRVNLTNLTNEELSDSMYPLELALPFTIVYAVIFVTGVVGNISTCFVIAKNKSMHTATNYYLFSLAVSDMLLLISGLPPEMYRIWSPNTYIFGQILCSLQGFSAETSANATVLTITAFTVERYLAICHPFRSHKMSKLSRCVRVIIIIWSIALALAIPQAAQFGIDETVENGEKCTQCTVVWNIFDHAFEASTIVFFVIPMVIITVLYILIGRQLKQSTAKRPSLTQHNSNSTSAGYSTYNNDIARRRRQTQAQNRVVKMLIAVVAAFFICWAPFHTQRLVAVYLASASPETQEKYYYPYLYLVYTSGVLHYVSTCINPLLYHIMSNKYRNAFKKTFHNFCSSSKNRTRNCAAVPLRLTTKKAPDNFLGRGAPTHRPPTVDAKTSSNNGRWNSTRSASHKFAKLSPQTSQTSFSSSRAETSQNLINRDPSAMLPAAMQHSNSSCASLKSKVLRLFKTGLTQGLSTPVKLTRSSNTISNSSLKDTDDMDLVCSDLVNHMQQVNELL